MIEPWEGLNIRKYVVKIQSFRLSIGPEIEKKIAIIFFGNSVKPETLLSETRIIGTLLYTDFFHMVECALLTSQYNKLMQFALNHTITFKTNMFMHYFTGIRCPQM